MSKNPAEETPSPVSGSLQWASNPAETNIISGNTNAGVDLDAPVNKVLQNFIGLDLTGSIALPNGVGIRFFTNADNNQIDIMGACCTQEDIVEGDDSLSSRTYSFSAVEIEEESPPITFGPNTFIIVELEMEKSNDGANAGDMSAIVTFYVTGPTADNVTITEIQDSVTDID